MTAKVFLDPGHGGRDPGAVGNGIQEKNINLALALACREYLLSNFSNVEIKMSRETDTFLGLKERSDMANKWGAELFLSFHINAAENAAAAGFETYIYDSFKPGAAKTKAEQLQFSLHKATAPRTGMNDRGMKSANFHVLRETNMTALLSENGFISNAGDAAKMKTPQWIQNTAQGHAEGIAAFLKLPRKAAAAPAAQTLEDVPGNSPYMPAIAWALDKGIMSQVNGQFGPAAPVTRAELAKILHAYDLKK